MNILIHQSAITHMRIHAEETFPEECCGVLTGDRSNGIKILEARRMKNINENKLVKYDLDPMELVEVDKELDESGLDMIGIYHSHPNHPAKPSESDRKSAWPNQSYMIISVKDGKSGDIRSWRKLSRDEEFQEESIEII